MDRVLEYLNTGQTVAFVGAGVSRELGIPAWSGLCKALLARLPSGLGERSEEAQRLFDAERYAELCGWIARNVSNDFLYSNCRDILKDTGANGEVSKFLATFPFASIFTTNFDDSLRRHFRAAGKAVSTVGNTQDDLASVDIDSLVHLVKLHSDLDHTDTIVLTDSQYSRVKAAGEFEYLRTFIKSYFTNRRFLFVGYSLTDPDIQLMLEYVAQNIRRKIPIFAIMADVLPEEQARLKELYNVEVVSYRNQSGTHRELVSLFQALAAFTDGPPVLRKDLDLDLRRAQSLYVWSRFGLSGDTSAAQVDALKSIILSALHDKPQTTRDLEESVGVNVGLTGELLSSAVAHATGELRESGLIALDAKNLAELSTDAAALVDKASKQHARLIEAFLEQTRLDLERRWPDVPEEEQEKAVQLAVNVIVQVFDERGVELVTAVLGDAEIGGKRSPNLFATLARAGAEMGTDDMRYRFVSYMAGLITEPADAQRAYLEHLALAFFSLHALAMDPDGHLARRQLLQRRVLVLDSNVLIPLVAKSGAFYENMNDMVALARDAGMRLMTTDSFIHELYRHGVWARDLVRMHGADSIQVLQAARGEGFKRNAFLDGFIRYSAKEKEVGLNSYLKHCAGGAEFTHNDLADYLRRELGVGCIDFASVASKKETVSDDRLQTEEFIRQEAEERLIDKGDSRIRAEGEVYAIVANWDAVEERGEASGLDNGDEVAVLSQGGFLNRIARFGPKPLDRYIVVPPAALYAFLLRSGSMPRHELSFRELMISPLFNTSAHFVDKDLYRKFFAHRINEAERIFRENLETLQSQIDANLKPEFFDDLEPLDRPYFGSSLQAQLAAKSAEAEAAKEKVSSQLAEVQRELKKIEKKSRNVEAALARKARKKTTRQGKKRRKQKK